MGESMERSSILAAGDVFYFRTLNSIQLNSAIALTPPNTSKVHIMPPMKTKLLWENEYLLAFIHFHVNLWRTDKAVAQIVSSVLYASLML
jgi:hypothetical protein